MEEALMDNVTVGAVSSSAMVMVTDWEPLSVAPPSDTLSIEIVTVSSSSKTLSSIGSSADVPVVEPALIVISETFS